MASVRRQTARAVAAALIVAVALIAGCTDRRDAAPDDAVPTTTGDVDGPGTTASTTSTTIAAESGCAPTVDGQPADSGPYAVGRRTVRYVDMTRRTAPADGSGSPGAAGRALQTVVLYPAEGAPGAEGGAIVDGGVPAPGRFPLVVYSHGVFSSGAERNDVLARWAAAGYVVVAPTFPLSSRPSTDISDLPNQPDDVVFATRTFTSEVQSPEHPLHGHVRGACLALAGHSLGGATALAAAFDPCCEAIRPLAVIDLAGVWVPLSDEATLGGATAPPLLVVHGSLDATVTYSASERVVQERAAPTWFVTFPQGGHNSMFEPPEVEVLDDAVVSFLDATLKGAPEALDGLQERVAAGGVARVDVVDGG